MFEGFTEFDIAAVGTSIHGRHGGDGPPVLLLHGIPETHLMWHRVAPRLAAVGAGTSILELGCGTGRVTHPLIELGHPVVAVDESPEMLAHVRGAETVCSTIQGLTLGRRFGAVLLASHLINADDETRSAFLAACRRHVADDGCVIVQQHAPEWFSTAAETEDVRDGVIHRLRDVSRPAPNLLTATVEYVVGDRCWTQTFTTARLDEAELAASLGAAGLRLDRYLTEDRSWFRAVPADVPGR